MTETKEKEILDNYLQDKNENRDMERLKKLLPDFVAAFAGLCFSRIDALSVVSPFAAAFIGAVPYDYCLGAFAGSVVGYLARFNGAYTVRYLLCLFFICAVRLLIHKRISSLEGTRASVITVLVAVTASAVLQQVIMGATFSGIAIAFVEGGIAFCGSYFFSRSFRTPVARIGLSNMTMGDRLSFGISAFIFVLCFSGISIENFSPARLVCCIIICITSYCKGISAGGVIGVCLGAAVSISPETRFVFPAFAVSGVISGIFSSLGQIAVGVAQTISFCACCVIGGIDESFLLPMIECAVAGAIFMLIPPVQLTRMTEFVYKNAVVSNESANLQVSRILKRASGNIYSFCETVDEVSTRLDRVINPEVNKLFFEIQQKVCDGCSKKSSCWSRNFDSTASDILAIMGLEKTGRGKLQLEKHCSRLHELKRQISQGKAQYSLSMLSKMKNREMRRLLTEQFSGLGDFLGELSEQIAKSRTADAARSTALRAVVIDAGVYVDALNCLGNDEQGLEVEIICFERPFETDYKKIGSILEKATGHLFQPAQISATESGTLLRYEEKPFFELIGGSAQRPFVRDAPCGDSIAFCKGNNMRRAVLLSDGMGTGSSAALDSMMAVSLLEKLLSGGFSFESGVRIVNSSLIMKSTDESLATVDGLCVNLYTGAAEFYKAGATISFIRSDREVLVVEESSLPLGILREVNYKKTVYKLREGDIVLIVSDGITAGDCGWINDELLSWSTNNMEDLAGHIVELAALRQDRFTGDDLTVVAVKLIRNKKE